jgi:hypothetical protein
MLRLLIDTSAWLDLATRRDGQKWIVPLRIFMFQGKLELLVPAVIIEEFDRNRPRLEAAVTTSVLDRLRQLRRELREFAGQQNERAWLEETTQHIPLVNAMTPQNFREIRELLLKGKSLAPTESEYARVVQRGLAKKAPFSTDKNSVADALLIELYASQLKEADPGDVHCFITSNHRDFSMPNGDHRHPHPDLADLFNDPASRYLYQVDGLHSILTDYFGDEFLEEYEEVEFLMNDEEPRTLGEILDAEKEFFDKVWYARSLANSDDENAAIPDDIREGMMAARARVEVEYSKDELWPVDAFDYGMLNGKLSALRWVLGSEWDFLDT